jgi:hypothetical protein
MENFRACKCVCRCVRSRESVCVRKTGPGRRKSRLLSAALSRSFPRSDFCIGAIKRRKIQPNHPWSPFQQLSLSTFIALWARLSVFTVKKYSAAEAHTYSSPHWSALKAISALTNGISRFLRPLRQCYNNNKRRALRRRHRQDGRGEASAVVKLDGTTAAAAAAALFR